MKIGFRTLITDLGGVLVQGNTVTSDKPTIDRLKDVYEIKPAEEMKLAGKVDDGIKKVQTGEWTIWEFEQTLDQLYGPSFKRFSLEEVSVFTAGQQMVEFVKRLRALGVRIIFSSNTIPTDWEKVSMLLERTGLANEALSNVRDIEILKKELIQIEDAGKIPAFISFNMGVRKGGESIREDDRDFFSLICEVTDINKDDTLVLDDNPKYVAYARRRGLRSHLFSDTESFRDKIFRTE